MNKYLEKIAQQGVSPFSPQPKEDNTAANVAKGVAVTGATALGASQGKKLGRKAADSASVQSKIKDRASQVSGKVSDRAQAKKDIAVGAQRKEIRKLDRTIAKDTRPGQATAAAKKKQIRQRVIKSTQDKAKAARSKAGRAAVENKFVQKATSNIKNKLGRKGALIGGGATLAASTAAVLPGKSNKENR